MAAHPIEEMMKTTMENIRTMVDVNIIVGDSVETADGTVIIPISRIMFGFATGGGDFDLLQMAGSKESKEEKPRPFSGGTGAGVSLQPVAFLVVGNGDVKLLPVDDKVLLGSLIEKAPEFMDKLQSIMEKKDKKTVLN